MDKEPGEKIYESGMGRFEIAAVLYELPLLLGALVAAYLFLGFFKILVLDRFFYGDRTVAFIMIAGIDVLGLAGVLLAASYFPKRITVYRDRIRFQMARGAPDVMLEEIAELRPLTRGETRRAFFSPGKACLSPSIRGAVLMRKWRGRSWVFSPADVDGFLAAVEQARAGGRDI